MILTRGQASAVAARRRDQVRRLSKDAFWVQLRGINAESLSLDSCELARRRPDGLCFKAMAVP